MKLNLYCPQGVDKDAQYQEALRRVDAGDRVTYHVHEEDGVCVLDSKRTRNSCWTFDKTLPTTT